MALTSKLETILSFSTLNPCVADPLTSSKKWSQKVWIWNTHQMRQKLIFLFSSSFFISQDFLYYSQLFVVQSKCQIIGRSRSLQKPESLFFCVQYFFHGLSFLLLFLATVQPVQKNLSWEKFLQKKKINKNGWIDAETISSQKESLSSTELWTTSF